MKDKYIWYEKDRGADGGHAAKKIVAGQFQRFLFEVNVEGYPSIPVRLWLKHS